MKPKVNIEYRATADLKLLEHNPRQIKKADFEKLKKSIKNNVEFFEARPIILSDRTGELVVIAGNQRLRASQELGIEQVPTVLLQGLTEEKEREIIIRDNVSNGDWDMDTLANDWNVEDLIEWGVNVPSNDFGDDATEEKDEKAPSSKVYVCGVALNGKTEDTVVAFKLTPAEAENALKAPEKELAKKIRDAIGGGGKCNQ